MGDILWSELAGGLPAWEHVVRAGVRILLAGLLGALIGAERESLGKPAGLRTHMLVAMGAALFAFAPLETGISADAETRVVQGIATGIGFIGAGAILKIAHERQVEGLTTAAGIWLTAALGMAVGLGRLGSAVASALLAWIVLRVVGWVEAAWKGDSPPG